MLDETKCLHSGYEPGDGEPGVMPIVQSTTYRYDSTERLGELFNLPSTYLYSRFQNPTVQAVERKIADLESGVGAMCTTSGQHCQYWNDIRRDSESFCLYFEENWH